MKSCRFVTNEVYIFSHAVRGLEITCENGFKETIYVTKGPAFCIANQFNSWHYDISIDGKITLKGIGTDSVNFGPECHETITNWPLLPDEIINDEPY